jgi:hypothetical protein
VQVENAVLKTSNTAPGEDEIFIKILKIAWSMIKDQTLALYQGCLQSGYHSKYFRHAILAILQKPIRTD